MNQPKPSVDIPNPRRTLDNPLDEKTKIIEARSPTKIKEASSPLPQVGFDKKSKYSFYILLMLTHSRSRSQKAVTKNISQLKSFGEGTSEFLTCRFDQEDNLIATGNSLEIV